MEKEAINSGWSIQELKWQISTSLYERLLLSEGKTNKKTVPALAEKGIENYQTDTRSCWTAQYVSELLCRRNK